MRIYAFTLLDFNAFLPHYSPYIQGDEELFIEDLVNEERSKRHGNKQKKKQKNHRNKQKKKSGLFFFTLNPNS